MNKTAHLKRLGKNACITLIIPGIALSLMLILCAIYDVPFLVPQGGFRAFIYTGVTTMFTAYALGIHLLAGRMDFSIGAASVLAAVIGTQIAIEVGANVATMLLIFIGVGVIIGAVSGVLYLLFNLPPIITSLGVTMAYEGLSFALTGGRGAQIAFYPALMGGASLPWMLALLAIGLVVMYIFFNFTRFGFNYRAIGFGQKIAVDTGLNEKSNALACYILSGALVAIVGFLRISFMGNQPPVLNLGTSAVMFNAMLPIFISGLMIKYCERNISLAIGAFTATIITQGLSSIGVSMQSRALITSFLMISILVYTSNKDMVMAVIKSNLSKKSQTSNS